jgi:hypothetical protein
VTAPTALHRAAAVLPDESARPGIGGRCETCRHWQAFDQKERSSEPWHPTAINRLGLCGQVKEASEYEAVDWKDNPADNHPAIETLALVEDMSNNAALRTAANFGCVLWEHMP